MLATLAIVAGLAAVHLPDMPDQESTPKEQLPYRPIGRPGLCYQLPDGSALVTREGSRIERVDVETGERLGVFHVGAWTATRMELDPRGEWLAWREDQGDVFVWPLGAGLDGTDREVVAARARDGAVLSLTPGPDGELLGADFAWSATGEHLVTWGTSWFHGTLGARVRLWSREGELIWEGPKAYDVAVDPGRNRIALVGPDGLQVGWPLGEDGAPRELETRRLRFTPSTVSFSPGRDRLAVGGAALEDPLDIRRSGAKPVLAVFEGEGLDPRFEKEIGAGFFLVRWAHRVRFSPDGSRISVSLGKGCTPAVMSADDGATVWAGDFLGGRMWSIGGVDWVGSEWIYHSFKGPALVRVEDGAAPKLPWPLARRPIALGETQDLLVVGVPRTGERELARVDARTGEVRWRIR